MEKEKRIIIKPQNGFNGNGIYIVNYDETIDIQKEFNKIKKENYVIEGVLEQEGVLKKLNPETLNTIRVNAFNNHGKVQIINAILRSGQGNTVTDNICAGGCVARINISNGKVETPFYDLSNHIYYEHPLTNVSVIGETIPYWEDVINTVKEGCAIVPDLGYTSWDIAVIKGGKVAIVEGNSYGNFNIQQVTGTGVRKEYDRYISEWRKSSKH